MSAGELALWDANIPHVFAEELLRERGGDLTAEQLGQATLLATGDEVKAGRAQARRWLEEHEPR